MKILIIEDDKEIVELLKQPSKENFSLLIKLIMVKMGSLSHQSLRSHYPRLLFTGKTGLEIINEIRSENKTLKSSP